LPGLKVVQRQRWSPLPLLPLPGLLQRLKRLRTSLLPLLVQSLHLPSLRPRGLLRLTWPLTAVSSLTRHRRRRRRRPEGRSFCSVKAWRKSISNWPSLSHEMLEGSGKVGPGHVRKEAVGVTQEEGTALETHR
jgi:hypothetical protein